MNGTILDMDAVRMRQAEQAAQAWRSLAIAALALLAGVLGGWMLKPSSRVFELRLSLPTKTAAAAAADANARATLETGMEPVGLEELR